MQARRHATALAAHAPREDLTALLAGTAGPARGLAAARQAWAGRRKPARGLALMIDTARDLPGAPALAGVCEQAQVTLPAGPARPGTSPAQPGDGEPLTVVTAMVSQALAIALASARYLGYYHWDGTLDITQVMAAHAWDCLPAPASTPANLAPAPARAGTCQDAAVQVR